MSRYCEKYVSSSVYLRLKETSLKSAQRYEITCKNFVRTCESDLNLEPLDYKVNYK